MGRHAHRQVVRRAPFRRSICQRSMSSTAEAHGRVALVEKPPLLAGHFNPLVAEKRPLLAGCWHLPGSPYSWAVCPPPVSSASRRGLSHRPRPLWDPCVDELACSAPDPSRSRRLQSHYAVRGAARVDLERRRAARLRHARLQNRRAESVANDVLVRGRSVFWQLSSSTRPPVHLTTRCGQARSLGRPTDSVPRPP